MNPTYFAIIARSCASAIALVGRGILAHSQNDHVIFDDEEDESREENTSATGQNVECEI